MGVPRLFQERRVVWRVPRSRILRCGRIAEGCGGKQAVRGGGDRRAGSFRECGDALLGERAERGSRGRLLPFAHGGRPLRAGLRSRARCRDFHRRGGVNCGCILLSRRVCDRIPRRQSRRRSVGRRVVHEAGGGPERAADRERRGVEDLRLRGEARGRCSALGRREGIRRFDYDLSALV